MALARTRTKKIAQKDPVYRDQLITEYLPYVKHIVHRLAVHLIS
jgi:DNA-directed RNA polymerase specialized sigma subunit